MHGTPWPHGNHRQFGFALHDHLLERWKVENLQSLCISCRRRWLGCGGTSGMTFFRRAVRLGGRRRCLARLARGCRLRCARSSLSTCRCFVLTPIDMQAKRGGD